MQKAKAQAGAVTSGGLPAVGAPTLHSLTSAGAKTLKKSRKKTTGEKCRIIYNNRIRSI
jgi:hypothetical protein